MYKKKKKIKISGSLDDSLCCVYIVYGLPRSGKSYFFQELINKSLSNGRQIVTNYPVYLDGVKRFDDRLLYNQSYIYNSDIYIDEAYSFFNSRKFRNFSDHMHRFFSLCGHCGNRIYLISQHPARLDKVIREVTSYFISLHCFRLPSGRPWLFRRDYYDSDPCEWGSISTQQKIRPLKREFRFFRSKIARSYNTHGYLPEEQPLQLMSWIDYRLALEYNTSLELLHMLPLVPVNW